MEHLNSLAGLDVTDFVPGGVELDTTGTVDVEKLLQQPLWRRRFLRIIEHCITSVGGKARVDKIRVALGEGVDMVAEHGEASHQAIEVPVHNVRIARFINEDLKGWSTTVHDAALSARLVWHEPPGIGELPRGAIPLGRRFAPTSTRAGWNTSTYTRARWQSGTKAVVLANVCIWMGTLLNNRVLVGPPSVVGGFTRKGDTSKFSHDPAK